MRRTEPAPRVPTACAIHLCNPNIRRKRGGAARMVEIGKRENFCQQAYCGCASSLRDTNRRRRATGRGRIEIGVKSYGRDGADAQPSAWRRPGPWR